MTEKNDIDRLTKDFDPDKRETLEKLVKTAWVVPVVATFGLGSLNSKSAADGLLTGNGTILS